METSINSKHGEVSWASLFRPTINKAERNISTKKARKGFRGKSRKSYSWNQSEHENFRGSQSSINSLEMSPRSPHSPMEQIMQADPAITKKILKLSDVQINQKLELNRPDLYGLPKGLVNRSNFCWINSMLQVLFATDPILKLIQNILKSGLDLQSTCPTIEVLVQTYSKMNQITGRGFEPKEMFQLFGKLNSEYKNGQHDAEEGLLLILNSIHDELDALRKLSEKNDTTTNNNNNIQMDSEDGDWQTMTKSGKTVTTAKKVALQKTTFISRYFGGSLTSSVRIESANEKTTRTSNNNVASRAAFSTTEQPFMTLPLEISKANDIQSALRYLSKVENVDGYQARLSRQQLCNCILHIILPYHMAHMLVRLRLVITKIQVNGNVVSASRKLTISKLPEILILTVKWFEFNPYTLNIEKVVKSLRLPETLTLPRECLNQSIKRKPPVYELYAIINHYGGTPCSGHYTSEVRSDTNYGSVTGPQWFQLDDSLVSEIPLDTVFSGSDPNRTPYILFYRRKRN